MRTSTLIVIVSGFVAIGTVLIAHNTMNRNDALIRQYSQPNPVAVQVLQAQYPEDNQPQAQTSLDHN